MLKLESSKIILADCSPCYRYFFLLSTDDSWTSLGLPDLVSLPEPRVRGGARGDGDDTAVAMLLTAVY